MNYKNEFIDLGIFLYCVALTVVTFVNGQYFLSTAFGIVSIIFIFVTIVKVGVIYIKESKLRAKKIQNEQQK